MKYCQETVILLFYVRLHIQRVFIYFEFEFIYFNLLLYESQNFNVIVLKTEAVHFVLNDAFLPILTSSITIYNSVSMK